jgi:MFS family permease
MPDSAHKSTAARSHAPFRWASFTSAQKRVLIAASLGWMLDAFDVMLYSLVLTKLLVEFGITKSTAGLLNTFTLIGSAIGSVLCGLLADRFGRRLMLNVSILSYSLFTFACGLSTNIATLGVFRFLLGFGMGGEWNTGAALVGETWPAAWRGRALSIVQSSWAVGYALAAGVAAIVLSRASWRWVFFIGLLPAALTLWIRRNVSEPALWTDEHSRRLRRPGTQPSPWRASLGRGIALFIMNAFGMFAWWGLFTWLPAYLALPIKDGGRGLHLGNATLLLIVFNLAGMLPGYLLFGVIADKVGRKTALTGYLTSAALMTVWFAHARSPSMILIAGCFTAFFGTGFFAGSGILGNELFPTQIRATALGVTYNGARGLSAAAPLVIGALGDRYSLSAAFYASAACFAGAAFFSTWLPETRGVELDAFGPNEGAVVEES